MSFWTTAWNAIRPNTLPALSTTARLPDAWVQFNKYANRTKSEQIWWLIRHMQRFDSRYHTKEEVHDFVRDTLLLVCTGGPGKLTGWQTPQLLHPYSHFVDGWRQFHRYAGRTDLESMEYLLRNVLDHEGRMSYQLNNLDGGQEYSEHFVHDRCMAFA